MAKVAKFLLVFSGILVAAFLAAAVILPRLYKDELLEVIREEANRDLQATLDFHDLHLSLFRQFPLLSIRMDSLSLTGKEEFEGMPLLRAPNLELAVSVWDLFRKDAPFDIRKLYLTNPEMQILILENGKANYDITLPDTTQADRPPSTFRLSLRDYRINNGRIRYEDRSMPVILDMKGLHHQGKGDFSEVRFDLETETLVDSLDFTYDGTAYFNKARLEWDVLLGVDMEAMAFTLKDNRMLLNALALTGQGVIRMPGEDIDVDIKVEAPSNDLRELWSLLPGAYTDDYAGLKTEGTFTLGFWTKGVYNEDRIPAFELTSSIKDGRVQYPDLPYPIEQIAMNLQVRQPGDRLDALEVDLPAFRFRIQDQEVRGQMAVRDVWTDPDVKAELKGTLDLGHLRQAFPVEATTLEGAIRADVFLAGRMSALDEGRYHDVDIRGTLQADRIKYQGPDQPMMAIDQGEMIFSPSFAEVRAVQIRAGRTDIALDGRIDNILAFLHPDRTLKGKLTMRSQLIDLTEWVETGTVETPVTSVPEEEEKAVGLPAEQFDLALDAKAGTVKAPDLEIRDLVIRGEAGPSSLRAHEISGRMGTSDFKLTGHLENLFDWMLDQGILRGHFSLSSQRLDLNAFMPDVPDSGSGQASPTSAIPVPDDVEITGDLRVGELIYTDMTLKEVSGSMAIGNQTVWMRDWKAQGFGGNIQLEGTYVAQDLSRPEFHFKYDVEQLDFRQVFNKVNTFRQLTPVGKYLDGRFSSRLVMDGAMDAGMNPDLTTLQATGMIETFQAVIQGFAPVDGLADKLRIPGLKKMSLKDSKTGFEIRNGTVELQEFDFRHQDIDMSVGGRHQLGGQMDYTVKAKIPRKYLDQTGITAQANTGMKWLEAEAGKLGIPLSVGEFVRIAVGIGGTMAKPTYSLKVLGTEGEGGTDAAGGNIQATLEKTAESLKDTIQDVARRKAEELSKQAEARMDSLKRQAESQVDSALVKAKEEAAKKIGDEAAKKIEEVGGDKAKQEADKLKEKIRKWDPFGKKKE